MQVLTVFIWAITWYKSPLLKQPSYCRLGLLVPSFNFDILFSHLYSKTVFRCKLRCNKMLCRSVLILVKYCVPFLFSLVLSAVFDLFLTLPICPVYIAILFVVSASLLVWKWGWSRIKERICFVKGSQTKRSQVATQAPYSKCNTEWNHRVTSH